MTCLKELRIGVLSSSICDLLVLERSAYPPRYPATDQAVVGPCMDVSISCHSKHYQNRGVRVIRMDMIPRTTTHAKPMARITSLVRIALNVPAMAEGTATR